MGNSRLASVSLLVSMFTMMAVVLVVLRVPPTGLISAVLAIGISLSLAFVFAHGSESKPSH
jgi:hypothetical protein